MIDAAQTAFVSMRRRYRHARTVSALHAASRRAHAERSRVVHMLHVGKTGGTAVQAALTATTLPAGLSVQVHGHGISLRDIPAEDEVFLFLRDPVARFVSGFEMRRREGRPRHYRPWTSAERRAFSRFDTAESLALALGSSVKQTRADAQRAMRGIYHVKSHLSDWLVDDDVVRARRDRLVFIGWQERLEPDFRGLVELLGMPPTTSLPTDAFEANRTTDEERARPISDEAAEILRAWYAPDYDLIASLIELGLTSPPDEVSVALTQRAR